MVGDLWAAYGRLTCASSLNLRDTVPLEQQPFTFYDIDQLTCFADYRIPQLLRAEGIFVYSVSLASRIDQYQELYPSSIEEIEIRAGTVVAVDRMRTVWNTLVQRTKEKKEGEKLTKDTEVGTLPLPRSVTSVEMDWYLWQEGEERKDQLLPHHRVNTIFY